MTGPRHEHSLRNAQVGESYMIMLDVYALCRQKNLPNDQICREIENANPWPQNKGWLNQAWCIAQREFYHDYGLSLPEPTRTDHGAAKR